MSIIAVPTEVANLALSHLGQDSEISDLDTEKSKAASAMRRFYPIAAEIALKDFPYSFSTVTEALNLVETNPTDEWAYSYRYPTDCLKPIRIPSGIRNETRQSRIPYQVAKGTSGKLIYTDAVNAELEYIQKVDDPSKWPSDFIMMLSYLLAAFTAPRICGEDPFKMGDKAMKMYQFFKGKTDSSDANEHQPEEPPEAEAIRART